MRTDMLVFYSFSQHDMFNFMLCYCVFVGCLLVIRCETVLIFIQMGICTNDDGSSGCKR